MQLSLFSGTTSFKIDKPIRLIELFGGISCQAQALLNLGVDFEEHRYCDFDKYACQSHNEIMGRIENHEGLSPTLDTRCDCLGVCKNYRIRKLTPTECLRLMGVRDEYSKRITCSNAQKYKQAGNGIVVDVLMAIFREML